MKRAGLLASAVVVALAAWMWLDRSAPTPRADRAPAAQSATTPDAAAVEPDAPEAPPSPQPESRPVTLRGRVVLIGSDRVPRRVTGRFMNLTEETATRFEAIDGRFEVEVTPGRYWVADFEVDGEKVKNFHQEVIVERADDVELRIPDIAEVTLVVVDARDRSPIADALVYESRDDDWSHEGNRLPGPGTLKQEPRRTDGSGRLPLGRGRGSVALYVHAEGRAWRAAKIPFGVEDEVVLELEPGGDVRLLIPRLAELLTPEITVERLSPHYSNRLVPPAGADEILVRGLVAADYEFTVRRGMSFELGRVYGTATGQVRAGETTTITLLVTPDLAPVMVKVTGTVRVPGGWNALLARLMLDGIEESNAEVKRSITLGGRRAADGDGFVERDGDGFRFEIPAVPAGRYLVQVAPYQWKRQVVLTDRSSHLELELPRPVTVRLQVLDAQGQDLTSTASARFDTRGEATGGDEGEEPALEDALRVLNASSPAQIEREGGALVFQAPLGTVVISAQARGFLDGELELEIREDRDVTLTLDRAGAVVVRLRIDGKAFDGKGVRVRLGRDGQSWETRFAGGEVRLDRIRPGRWTASIGEVPGCEPAQPVEVEVAAGETREVWIDLTRKH